MNWKALNEQNAAANFAQNKEDNDCRVVWICSIASAIQLSSMLASERTGDFDARVVHL